jgi:hypothetical protein
MSNFQCLYLIDESTRNAAMSRSANKAQPCYLLVIAEPSSKLGLNVRSFTKSNKLTFEESSQVTVV